MTPIPTGSRQVCYSSDLNTGVFFVRNTAVAADVRASFNTFRERTPSWLRSAAVRRCRCSASGQSRLYLAAGAIRLTVWTTRSKVRDEIEGLDLSNESVV